MHKFFLIGFLVASPLDQPKFVQTSDRKWEDEIVYVIIVQKFFNGDKNNDVMLKDYGKEREKYEGGFWGGDLQGIIQKLDYIEATGATAILLYPIVDNDKKPFCKYLATGYRPKDYYKVDENFGDLETLQKLVKKANEKGIRIILDMPLGIPGVEHPTYQDPEKRKEWFSKMTIYGIPQWDAEKKQVADYLIEVSKFWRDKTGCDGFRLDSAHMHSTRFWKRYSQEIKSGGPKKNFFLLAEVPLSLDKIAQFIKETGVDSAYDFSSAEIQKVVGKGEKWDKIKFVIKEMKKHYESPHIMCAHIDDYDVNEFVKIAIEPKSSRMKLALAYLLTIDRIPLFYTGSEKGLSYQAVGALFEKENQDQEFLKYVQKLISIRKSEIALRRGDFSEIQTVEPHYAFLRKDQNERILVILNNSKEARSTSFALGADKWQDVELCDLLKGNCVKPKGKSTPVTSSAPQRGAAS